MEEDWKTNWWTTRLLFMPPFRGIKFQNSTADLKHCKGIIMVLDSMDFFRILVTALDNQETKIYSICLKNTSHSS